MKRIPNEIETKAAEALNALLHQVSSIKTTDIKFQPIRRKSDILADIDVLGRKHRLVCNVAQGEESDVRKALDKLKTCADGKRDGATPVVIAPYMTPEARQLCEKNRVGFVDLQGNARLVVDDVFIGKRSVKSASHLPTTHRLSA